MIRYRGRQYTALKPDQKAKKRQYLLEQFRREDRIPTWEEVREYILVEAFPDDYPEDIPDEEHYEMIAEQYEGEYDASVDLLIQGMEGHDCWRAVKLPAGVDPTKHDDLGIYWSWEETGAFPYNAAGDGALVTYHATIDWKYVNKEATVIQNVTRSEEMEVRFYQHAPIFVYDVTLEDGTVLEINDWRRC